jgi:hypothetical protein
VAIGLLLTVFYSLCLFWGFRTGEMLVKEPLPNANRQSSPTYFWTVAIVYAGFVAFGIGLVFEG